jgi:hypothetical protein
LKDSGAHAVSRASVEKLVLENLVVARMGE